MECSICRRTRHRQQRFAAASSGVAGPHRYERGGQLLRDNDPSYTSFLDTIRRAAASETVILLQGESGTGKNDLEREHIARVLARASSLESAARILGIDATTLHRKRKRYGLA
jgi:NtrC-family two-component system response regulator AlgB